MNSTDLTPVVPAPAAKRPVGVVLAAIVLALFTCLGVLSGIASFLTPILVHPPQLEQYRVIEVTQITFGILLLLLCALCGWMVVGLFRVKRWARVGMIVLGAVVAVISFPSAVLYFVLAFVPMPIPQGSPTIAPAMMKLVFFGLAGFSLLFTLIGVWWLVYFNLRSVRALFGGNGAPGSGARAQLEIVSQAPAQAAGVWTDPRKPARSVIEVMVICLAVLYLLGALYGIAEVLVRFPLFLFGHVIRGTSAAMVGIVMTVINLWLGIGLLRKMKAAWITAIVFNALWVVFAAQIFSPSYRSGMETYQRELMAQSPFPMVPGAPVIDLGPIYCVMGIFTVLIVGGILWLLWRAKPLFEPKKSLG
jgi:hypothetical protein